MCFPFKKKNRFKYQASISLLHFSFGGNCPPSSPSVFMPMLRGIEKKVQWPKDIVKTTIGIRYCIETDNLVFVKSTSFYSAP